MVIEKIKDIFERHAFGVCTWLGERLQMRLTDERFGIRTEWRTLTEDEWAAHVALETVVALWFRDKLEFAAVPHRAKNN